MKNTHWRFAILIFGFALCLGIAGRSRGASSPPGISGDPEWACYAAALGEAIGYDSEHWMLHIVRVPTVVEWDHPRYGDWAMLTLANAIPQWDGDYIRSGRLLDQSYRLFLNHLLVPVERLPINDLEKIWKPRARALNTLNRTAGKLLRDEPSFEVDVMEFTEALQFAPRRSCDREVSVASLVDNAIERLWELLDDFEQYFKEEVPGPFKMAAEAIINYENDAYRVRAANPHGERFAYHSFSISPDLAQWLESCRAGACQALEVSIPCSGRKGLQIHAKFQGYQVFEVAPGPWFSREVIQAYRDGPWVNGGRQKNPPAFWGPNGLLNLMVTKLLVVYKPDITIITDEPARPAIGSEQPARDPAARKEPFDPHSATEDPRSPGSIVQEKLGTDRRRMFSSRSDADQPYLLAVISARLP